MATTIDLGEDLDVIVVGAGNAATCAALSARENGARVLMLEIAPEEERGGNSAFTGGAFRVVYHGADDLARLIPDMNETELRDVDFGTYTEEQYFDDMGRLTQYRCDPEMTEILIRSSFETGVWMRGKGVRFQLGLGRQAFRVDGKFKFWGGLACHIWGGGKELMKALHARAARDGITVLYETPAIGLLQGDRGVEGVRVRHQGRIHDLRAKAVILACGGFEANAEMRARYLGPNWDLAKVRGTRFNTGQGLKMALDLGVAVAGHWSGAHAVAWDLNAPPRPAVPFNPNIRDGLATSGLAIDKTNWAQRLDTPPYEAYAVTTGITFTFGGLKITGNAEVEDTSGHPIPGLYAAGEIVGGLFYHNYASGTGLMSGAVLGRIAGRSAAALAAIPMGTRFQL